MSVAPRPAAVAVAIPWPRLVPGVVLVVALLLLFRDTAQATVTIWLRSETFTHCILVPPIVLWLFWRSRARLAQAPVRPVPWLLVLWAGGCLLWLLGELASVNAATQLALVTLIVLVVPAVYGWAVARVLAFPLLFLYFAVPVGEFMVAPMMEWTADFTVAALQATGLPVYREGLQFVIPSGSWSVVEACSGVRYLIASFMVGTLFAYLNYNSLKRRLVFAAVSLAVPIVANWLRAYMIVMLGHLSGNELATGVDHLVYGWVFFGIVIGIMFVVGARWSEPELPLPAPPTAISLAPSLAAAPLWRVAAAALALAAGTQALMWQLDRPRGTTPVLALPAAADGWALAAPEGPALTWQPNYKTANVQQAQAYRRSSDGALVTTWVGYYRDQNYQRKLITSTNGLVEGTTESRWAQAASGGSTAAGLPVRTAVLRGSDVSSVAAPRLRVWQLYWVAGRFTTSDARAKVMLALNRLAGRGDDAAVLLLHTPLPADGLTEAADALLQAHLQAHLAALQGALQSAQAGR